MNMKNIFGMVAASLLMLFCSCSNELEYGSEGASEANYAVRFTLGGSATKVTARATTGEIQTDKEKEVKKLYAVVFKDETGEAKTGSNNAEKGTEKFYKKIDVCNAPNFNLGDLSGEFEVGREGAYQICFIANPGENLLNEIEGLSNEATVNDFKQLVVTQAPETQPMLMSSGFYGATINRSAPADLQTVNLVRAMARVDIVNQAPGVTITNIVFNNRAEQTVLISDNEEKANQEFKRSEFTDLKLAGKTAPDQTAIKTIYSYEQFGKESKAPSLVITYQIDTKRYTHNVEFKAASKEGGAEQQINLKRNHLYKVILTNESDNIGFTLSVADWDTREIFEVSNNDISNGLIKKQIEVGDFLCKDGNFIKWHDDTNISNNKNNIIGVVFHVSTNTARIGKKALEYFDKAQSQKSQTSNQGDYLYGLVMSVKNLVKSPWRNSESKEDDIIFELKNTPKACYEDVEGYAYTKAIWGRGDATSTDEYSAFKSVKEFNNNNPNSSSNPNMKMTDWYLPATGEWYDILENLGGVCIPSEAKTSTDVGGEMSEFLCDTTALVKINTHFKKVGGDNLEDSYWCSSVYSDKQALRIRVNNDNTQVYLRSESKKVENNIRSVRAFRFIPRRM